MLHRGEAQATAQPSRSAIRRFARITLALTAFVAVTGFSQPEAARSAVMSRTAAKPVSMTSTPSGAGYWIAAEDGGVFSFGDAQFYGSTGATPLNKPVVGIASTPTGHGYWLVAADGGIFSFGDARFYGSTGATPLNKPVVGIAPTPTGHGYWLVAADGGIFSFGDAQYYGSTGATPLNKPVVGIAATPDGHGYRFVAGDGGVFDFGQSQYFGRVVYEPAPAPTATLSWPLPVSASVTGKYGEYRPKPTPHTHSGVDLAASSGTEIFAAADGRVVSSGSVSGYGEYTCIEHTAHLATCYAHQSTRLVTTGSLVSRGQLIGRVGSTGTSSTGPHLHFEVKVDGRFTCPASWLGRPGNQLCV